MFSDLRGFTAMSENATKEHVYEALNGYFDVVVQSVEENGGDVLKFMGDGILSIFPISDPADRPKHCRNAARAAQELNPHRDNVNQAVDRLEKEVLGRTL